MLLGNCIRRTYVDTGRTSQEPLDVTEIAVEFAGRPASVYSCRMTRVFLIDICPGNAVKSGRSSRSWDRRPRRTLSRRALAVGAETMKRARHNVELIIRSSKKSAHRFTQEADTPERINFAIAPERCLKAIRENTEPRFAPKNEQREGGGCKIKSMDATRI